MTSPTPPNSPSDPGATAPVLLDIGGPAHGGTAVARLSPVQEGSDGHEGDAGDTGRVVFVRGALPGETGVPVLLDPEAPGRTRRFRTGSVADPAAITGPSAHRTAPVCAAAAAGAGCCDLDIVDAAGSADWKRQVIVDQFRRIGHVDLDGAAVTTVSPEPFTGYRTRVRLGVDAQGRAGLRRPGSHGIVPVDEAVCAQWDPALVAGLAGELAEAALTPGAEVCVAVGDDGARSVVELVRESTGKKTTRGRRDRRRNGAPRRRTRRRVVSGTGTVTHTVDGVTWTVPAEAFWQAHRAAPALYGEWIARAVAGSGSADSTGGAVAWDLYGGAGVFAAALTTAVPGLQVDCVDVASEATGAGRAALDGRDVRFVAGDVADHLGDLRGADGHPFAVVLDPPRTGAGDGVIAGVTDRRPGHILHIGCDPATAARDAGALQDAGYRPESVTVVDAFGLTHHVEVLVHYVPAPDGV